MRRGRGLAYCAQMQMELTDEDFNPRPKNRYKNHTYARTYGFFSCFVTCFSPPLLLATCPLVLPLTPKYPRGNPQQKWLGLRQATLKGTTPLEIVRRSNRTVPADKAPDRRLANRHRSFKRQHYAAIRISLTATNSRSILATNASRSTKIICPPPSISRNANP